MLHLIYDNGRYVGPQTSFEKSKKTPRDKISQDDLRQLFKKYQSVVNGLNMLRDPQRLIEPDHSMLQAANLVQSRIRDFGARLEEGYFEEQKAAIDFVCNLIKPHLDAFRAKTCLVEAAMLEVDCG